MRLNYGKLFSDGTRAGLGLELAANSSWFGKGGDIAGYTADLKIWPANSGTDWGVAFICNQELTGKALSSRLHDILAASSNTRAGGVGNQTPSAPDPLVELSRQYEPLARQVAQRYLSQAPTSEVAWQQAKKELVAYPNGPRLVSLLERGDLKGALQLLPSVMLPNGASARR